TMADVNVNALADQAPTMAPPTRTDDQILPHIRWVPIGKSNCYLDVEKSQSNPIYKIAVDILKHTNFFKAFTASSTIPSIYIQQFWDTRALTTIINMCLTGKTSGFERPRDLVLQILWGVVNRAHINYEERIWEEFTQSIHTFIKDKKNLAHHTYEKKKATLIVIPSIRFTKVIIYYLQRKHKFHPKPDSPLHLPNEELVLGYLKFSAKGTKREIFRMPIPGNLITADIQGEPYYQEYLEKVAKHQRYLAGEIGSDPESPAPKPAKATKKSKPSVPKADLRPPVIKPASSQQPKPKPTPAKSQGKKSESVDEGIPEKEPRVDDEEADIQRALEESLKSVYDAPRGPLPPVVIREPEFGKYQPLLEVQGKGKEKVTDEQVALDLLTLQTPKKKSPADYEVESDEDVPVIDARVPDEGQARPNLGDQDECQAGPNPGEQDEGQAGPNPGDAAASQPQSSHEIDKGFTATAYLKVHENLKLTVEEQVILEEPASSTGTLSSLQHLAKDLSFGDLFFNDKQSKADNEKTTAETQAESMVSITIQQDTSAIPPMTTPIVHLTSRPDSPNVSKAVDEIVTDAVDWAIQSLLQNRFRDLPEADIKEILHQRMWETNSYKTHEDHMMLYEALEKSMNRDHTKEFLKDLAEARKKKKNRRKSPKTPPGSPPHQPPPPSPPAGPSGTSGSPGAFGSSQVPPPPHPPPSTNQEVHSSNDEDIRNAYIPKASSLASTYSPPLEDSLLAETGDMAMFMDWFYKRQGITELKPQDLEGPAFELAKVFHPNVTIKSDFFFNEDLEYLRYGSKGSRPALSISKMKAAYYPDVGLEKMVPDHMWIEEECKAVRTHMRILSVVRIEVVSMYGYDMKKIVLRKADLNEYIIAERDFKYLYPSDFEDLYLLNLQGHLNHLPPKDKKILTTVVNLWTRHLVIRQRVEDFQLGIESYQTQLNLTKPRWDATGFEYKHDYTVIDSPRSVTFRDRYGVKMIMWFNEIYKFSDGTLHPIDEALDYRVKEFKVNRMNSGLNKGFRQGRM
nr:E-beta-farnesene synthase [Tanacetum cinerariifolium]